MRLKSVVRAVSGALVAIGLAGTAQAQSNPYSGMVVFGDSLSDGGAYTNFIRTLGIPGSGAVTYFQFTTNPGNVWVDDIAAQFGLSLTPNMINGWHQLRAGRRPRRPAKRRCQSVYAGTAGLDPDSAVPGGPRRL